MATASCPCCGNKEPVPDKPRGRRIICSNCGTPFSTGTASPPPPAQPEKPPQVDVVAVEPVAPPPRKKPSTPAPPPPPRPKRRSKEPDRPARKAETPAPASTWETLTDDSPAARDDRSDDREPPPSKRRSRKRSSGCSIALVVGAIAFLMVLFCGGLPTIGYFVLRPRLGDGIAAATTKDSEGTDKKPAETEYVDAKTGNIRAGDVRVSVSAATIDFVKGSEGSGEFKSKEKLLALRLRIDNTSSARKVEYTSWGSAEPPDESDLPRLTDEHGTAYKLITFGGERRVEGQLRSESIHPGKGVSDVLVFDAPAPGAQTLTLDLPAQELRRGRADRFPRAPDHDSPGRADRGVVGAGTHQDPPRRRRTHTAGGDAVAGGARSRLGHGGQAAWRNAEGERRRAPPGRGAGPGQDRADGPRGVPGPGPRPGRQRRGGAHGCPGSPRQGRRPDPGRRV